MSSSFAIFVDYILRQSGIDCQPMLTIMALAKRIAKIIAERF